MTLERIHLFVLSLVVRLIGLLFLYNAALEIQAVFNSFFFPGGVSVFDGVVNIAEIILKLVLAVYFIVGAPPFLRWAQQIPR